MLDRMHAHRKGWLHQVPEGGIHMVEDVIPMLHIAEELGGEHLHPSRR